MTIGAEAEEAARLQLIETILVIGTSGDGRLLIGALAELGVYASLAHGLEDGTARVIAERPDVAVVELPGDSTSQDRVQVRLLAGWTNVVVLAARSFEPAGEGLKTVFWPDDPTAVAAAVCAARRAEADTTAAPHALAAIERYEVDDLLIDPRSMQVYVGGQDIDLTAAEFRILHMLALAGGAPIHRSEISRRAGLSDTRTTDVIVSRIRRKLERANARRNYVGTRVRQGYFFDTGGEPDHLEESSA